jgi:membrane-associated protein
VLPQSNNQSAERATFRAKLSGPAPECGQAGHTVGVTEFLKNLGEHVGGWLYVITAALAFGEAAILIGMVLPGETALLVAGYFCHEKVLNIWIMLPLAIVAAIAGDSVGYAFGMKFGTPLRASRLGHWVGERRWTRVDDFLNKHGGRAVLIGRLTALLRALVPSMCGMARMRYRTFLIWNAIGGILWAGACVWLGFAFAASLRKIETFATWAPIPVVVLIVGGWIVFDVRKKRRERAEALEFAEAEAN